MFFELLSKLISLAYQQNLHEDSCATVKHDGIKIGAVYISAKSKFVSTPQIARIAVTSFKLHESRRIILQCIQN